MHPLEKPAMTFFSHPIWWKKRATFDARPGESNQ
jgi:hypothetical protein